MASPPPDNLLRARRRLDELPFYTLVDDWAWHESAGKWALCFALAVVPAGLIPAKTTWFMLADSDYPWGDIEIHPAKAGGIAYTFPHQSYNAVGKTDLPWRDGKICAQTPMRYSRRRAYDIEPYTIDERLQWCIIRAREWLEAAAAGQLNPMGEPFELPDFPRELIYSGLGFIEDAKSFQFWHEQTALHGVAVIARPEGDIQWAVITSFSDSRDRNIRSVKYGSMLSPRSRVEANAMWLRLPGIPVLPPWQAPATFGELRAVMTEHGVDFNDLVLSLAPRFRNSKRTLLLLGFPIPATVGGEGHRYHWQALRLPVLTHGKLNGYRPTEANYARNDILNILTDKVHIDWVISSNWDEEQIRTRGRASVHLTGAKILLLGCGAVGSSVAELLIREGCNQLLVVDGDILDTGNLCRHTLSLNHIYTHKASSLAARLNNLSPHAAVRCILLKAHDCSEAEWQQMAECSIIIDCTGDDRMVHQLSAFPWTEDKLFISISLGLHARRLFAFSVLGRKFPHDAFVEAMTPWLEKELQENSGLELPRERIGCWHPVFPACADDIWMMSAVSMKCIDAWSANPPHAPCMRVYEQAHQDGFPLGVRLVDSP